MTSSYFRFSKESQPVIVRKPCDEAGDGGPAGVVGAEHLAEEHPQGDQQGEDPVKPPSDGGQRVGEDIVGEDVGERQPAVLEELPPQEGGLPADRPG